MKFLLVILLFVSFSVQANEAFWKDVFLGKASEWNGKDFILLGKLTKKKRMVWARDNYWNLEIQDPSSDKYVTVKVYTIINFDRINTIDCEIGEMMSLSGKLTITNKKNEIGKILIKKKNDKIICHSKEKEKK